jgi:AraC-like DNA-binding protein
MVAAAVAPSAQRVAVAARQIDVGRKEQVRQAVRRHLRTPTLAPKTLSRLVGISRSNLYRLFEHEGGVARYIQRERLFEARTVLSGPASTQSVSAVAEDLCFADASSFSRVFKREFGCSPGRRGRPGSRSRRHEAAYSRNGGTLASSSVDSSNAHLSSHVAIFRRSGAPRFRNSEGA